MVNHIFTMLQATQNNQPIPAQGNTHLEPVVVDEKQQEVKSKVASSDGCAKCHKPMAKGYKGSSILCKSCRDKAELEYAQKANLSEIPREAIQQLVSELSKVGESTKVPEEKSIVVSEDDDEVFDIRHEKLKMQVKAVEDAQYKIVPVTSNMSIDSSSPFETVLNYYLASFANDMNIYTKPLQTAPHTSVNIALNPRRSDQSIFDYVPMPTYGSQVKVTESEDRVELNIPAAQTAVSGVKFTRQKMITLALIPILLLLCIIGTVSITAWRPYSWKCEECAEVLREPPKFTLQDLRRYMFLTTRVCVLGDVDCRIVWVVNEWLIWLAVIVLGSICLVLYKSVVSFSTEIYEVYHFYCYPKREVFGRTMTDVQLAYVNFGITMDLVRYTRVTWFGSSEKIFWHSPELINPKGSLDQVFDGVSMSRCLAKFSVTTDLPSAIKNAVHLSIPLVVEMYKFLTPQIPHF